MDSFQTNKKKQANNDIDNINTILLLKQPELFKSTFYKLTCQSSEAIKNQDYNLGLKALNKCIEMIQIDKIHLKDISRFWKACLTGNLACCYQNLWKIEKAHKFCYKLQQQFNKLLRQGQNKQTQLKIYRQVIKLRFQHCPLVSQLNQHQKALQISQSTIPMIKQIAQQILAYISKIKQNSKISHNDSNQCIQFSSQVTKSAQDILLDLLKIIQQPIVVNQQKKPLFYYWHQNPQKNQEQIKKIFVPNQNSDWKKSILGVNKNKHWIDDFNIGKIMYIGQLNITDFENPQPLQQYLFKDLLYELVINCSVAYFTIATQLRYIDAAKKQQRKNANNLENKPKLNQKVIISKYGYQEKSQDYKLSEVYHLKSIDIVSRSIKFTIPYISHLIQSYQKHYIHQKQLQPITAIVQQSALSLVDLTSLQHHQKQISNIHQKSKQNQVEKILEKPKEEGQIQQVQIYYQSSHQYNQLKPKNKQYRNEQKKKLNSLIKYKSTSRLKSPSTKSIKKIKQEQSQRIKNDTKKQEKPKKNPQKIKKKDLQSKKNGIQGQKQLRFKHQSCTSIKFVIKKKK